MAGQRVLSTKGAVALFASKRPHACVRTFVSLERICQRSVYRFVNVLPYCEMLCLGIDPLAEPTLQFLYCVGGTFDRSHYVRLW
jgi:hypothetical protein